MKKIICFLFGHTWIYGNVQGIQGQPTERACKRCEEVQHFYGHMSMWEGTFGQLWYSRKDWRTEAEQKIYIENAEQNSKQFKELTRK